MACSPYGRIAHCVMLVATGNVRAFSVPAIRALRPVAGRTATYGVVSAVMRTRIVVVAGTVVLVVPG